MPMTTQPYRRPTNYAPAEPAIYTGPPFKPALGQLPEGKIVHVPPGAAMLPENQAGFAQLSSKARHDSGLAPAGGGAKISAFAQRIYALLGAGEPRVWTTVEIVSTLRFAHSASVRRAAIRHPELFRSAPQGLGLPVLIWRRDREHLHEHPHRRRAGVRS